MCSPNLNLGAYHTLNFVPQEKSVVACLLPHAHLTTHSRGPQGSEPDESVTAVKLMAWCSLCDVSVSADLCSHTG